eukprot:COSAG02_NODE_182_length_30594_cov_23.562912_16_plen_240_part_00
MCNGAGAEVGYSVLFAVVSMLATLVVVVDDREATEKLRDQPLIGVHFSSPGCADNFVANDSSSGGFGLNSWIAVVSWAGLLCIAVLVVVVPRRSPGCVRCINVGTPDMKQRLMNLVERGRMDVVNHVMLLLSAYLLFVTAGVQLSYVPLLGLGNQFNMVCLADASCSAAVQLAHEGSGPGTVCCDTFGLECAHPLLFWGALIGVCIGPLVPLPCVLWRISSLMKVAEESDVLLAKPAGV